MNAAGGALRVGIFGVFALALLQVAWHGWLAPPPVPLAWPALVVAVLPLLPALWLSRRNPRRGVLVGGIVCLFYFCHGVAAAWSDPAARVPALLEIALCLLVIGASGWDARHYRRTRR